MSTGHRLARAEESRREALPCPSIHIPFLLPSVLGITQGSVKDLRDMENDQNQREKEKETEVERARARERERNQVECDVERPDWRPLPSFLAAAHRQLQTSDSRRVGRQRIPSSSFFLL